MSEEAKVAIQVGGAVVGLIVAMFLLIWGLILAIEWAIWLTERITP